MKGKMVLAGIIGAAVGAVASYILTRRYYENAIYEETKIKIEEKPEEDKPQEDKVNKIAEIIAYANEVAKNRERTNYSVKEKETDIKPLKKKSDKKPPIRSIPYLEYGDNEDYGKKVFYLYEDGVIADEDDEILEKVEQTLGPNPREHIDEFDTGDMCYFVNDDKEMYYELYLSEKSYYGDVVDDDE